ncbi:hypothetical protein MTO96_013262 [Rhipicephalus appendiculatus]
MDHRWNRGTQPVKDEQRSLMSAERISKCGLTVASLLGYERQRLAELALRWSDHPAEPRGRQKGWRPWQGNRVTQPDELGAQKNFTAGARATCAQPTLFRVPGHHGDAVGFMPRGARVLGLLRAGSSE